MVSISEVPVKERTSHFKQSTLTQVVNTLQSLNEFQGQASRNLMIRNLQEMIKSSPPDIQEALSRKFSCDAIKICIVFLEVLKKYIVIFGASQRLRYYGSHK